MQSERYDIVVVGAGAAGLFAAIAAARAGPGLRVLAVDGARSLGAKVLVAGGGRCNVTHFRVDEGAYAGSSPHAIRKVLRQFTVEDTVAFFAGRGVELKREETGKLFPTTDDARTVLDALLGAARDGGVELRHPWRVGAVERAGGEFVVRGGEGGSVRAGRVVIATGGKALPKTGSDGLGYGMVRTLGHTVTPADAEGGPFPALVPLLLEKGHWLTGLSGITLEARLELRSATGKRLRAFTGSTLITHVGLSGPAVLDMSRYYTAGVRGDPGAVLCLSVLPGETAEALRQGFERHAQQSLLRFLCGRGLPERLARGVCGAAGTEAGGIVRGLSREQRGALVEALTSLALPITGDRGWLFAEVTAGGVPLSEVRLETMESRVCPGLHLCGEVLDVDGRIGGFNFQWAWASGHVAGCGAAG
ncbi:MAG: aminoacetone oxidase family FAD-binding enzyme [Phycisphaerales bacterium]